MITVDAFKFKRNKYNSSQRKIRTALVALIISINLSGCVSTHESDVFINEKIDSPKIIAISGPRSPWLFEIEKRLRENGFTILRMTSQQTNTEIVNGSIIATYNKATSRYVLSINGYAPNTSMERCFGGGYKFDHINVELVDIERNQTVAYYSNSGYSENCPPLSGRIFGDITNMVSQAWK